MEDHNTLVTVLVTLSIALLTLAAISLVGLLVPLLKIAIAIGGVYIMARYILSRQNKRNA